MNYLKFQNLFIKSKYMLLITLILVIQSVALNQMSKEASIQYIKQDQDVWYNQINNLNNQISKLNDLIENDKHMPTDKKSEMQNNVNALNDGLVNFKQLKGYLDQASVQLTFYEEYNETFFKAKRDYISKLTEITPADSTIYLELSTPTYMNLFYEIHDLTSVIDGNYSNEMYEVRSYERIYLNCISYIAVFVLVIFFALEANFLKSRKDSLISFVPKTFTKRFFRYYGNLLLRFLGIFAVSLIGFVGYLFIKGHTPLFDSQVVLFSSDAPIDSASFWLIYLLIVVGWTLMMLATAFIKEILSLWIDENNISTLMSILLVGVIFHGLGKLLLGLNIYSSHVQILFTAYGTAVPIFNQLLCCVITGIIIFCVVNVIRYFYNRI